ncbi:uncharacterized protein LTR77_006179 [Saxophila tyrrhenica]|uniref:Zn(2)-C6 fungal-type domain-containing protein n=1 Tax=Saxophila tyrrhenica TaxID=1690608 RepID=A0AAV9P7V4_9PEZI|nr:hypothetical protein LTR77_006179 [Saxophila tyrrhenica]
MSAAVMSNFYFPLMDQDHGYMADSQLRVQNWMRAQMAQYPPPHQAEQQQYNPLYPASTGAQQLVDPQQQLQFTSLNQPVYPKTDGSGPPEQTASTHQMHNLAQELQQHAALSEQQRHHLQQTAHHNQHHSSHGTPPPGRVALSPLGQQQHSTPESGQKANRLRKACDSCSIRKVKCDEAGPPCRACSSLDIPCTFDRPSRRRGPPNRHAEAIKRRRLEDGTGSPLMSATSAPSSPTHAAQALAALSSHTSNQQLSAESICPVDTLDLLIDDYFTYIHPLAPFPHEPSFREAWKRREDLTNSSFLALLASMIGGLVASFPRKPRLHLKSQGREHLYPNHMSMVLRCQKVATLARGPGYLESETLSVYDAATSYLLAMAAFYSFRWRPGRLYLGECMTIVRTLGLHKVRDHRDEDGSPSPPIDNITLEIGRRVFWTTFVTIKSMQQLGAASNEPIIPPPTPRDPHPPLPLEVDDFCIYPTHTERQPMGIVPTIAGFNANLRLHCSYNPLSTMELAWGIDAVVDWERQEKVLYESLHRCKDAINQMPPELRINAQGGVSTSAMPGAANHSHPSMHNDAAASLMTAALPGDEQQTLDQRRRMQYEIQKANIYASALSTRSYIVEKYWNLCEARERSRSPKPASPGSGITATGLDGLMSHRPTSNPSSVEQEMRQEREGIVRDLLVVLSTIDVVNMEPNADSFTMKIRSIAGTLLDAPDPRRGHIPSEAQEYLNAFLKILMRLERVSPPNSDSDQPEDDETEFRNWADLRDYQMKFAQQGGVLGLA